MSGGGSHFVGDLALVLGMAGVTGAICRRLGQPVIVGYLAAGMIVGPKVPIPMFADPERVNALAEFGVVLVMFAVGLEFRMGRLLRTLPRAGFATLFGVGVLAWLGYTVGRLIGLAAIEQVFLGAAIAISSTMVVSRIYDEQRVDRRARDLVFGVLVVQDLVAIVLVAVLTAFATGRSVSVDQVGRVVLELALALLALGVAGLLLVPRAVRSVLGLHSAETSVVTVAAVAFSLAAIATALGYSPALGAFLGGVLVAEAGVTHQVETLVRPLRDVFAAVFFVSIGMIVDPFVAFADLPAVLLVSAVVILGQLASMSLAGVLSGNGLRASVIAGLSLGQVGEFGFLMAAIGMDAGGGPRLIALVVGVALVTTFTTPAAVRMSDRIVHHVDAHMPRRLQRLLSVYETWFERLRRAESPVVRTGTVIVIDAALLAGLAALTGVLAPKAAAWLVARGVPSFPARLVLPGAALLLAIPFLVGAVRSTRALGTRVANEVVPPDLRARGAESARRMIEASVHLLVLLGVGAPAIAFVRPFLGAWGDLVGLLGLLAIGAAGLVWRRAGELQDEVMSGAAEVARLLGAPTLQKEDTDPAQRSFPGLEAVVSIPLKPTSPAVGRTLAEIDLRAVTGASVIAIARDGKHVVSPTGHERLAAGDVLGVVGTPEAVQQARALLAARPAESA